MAREENSCSESEVCSGGGRGEQREDDSNNNTCKLANCTKQTKGWILHTSQEHLSIVEHILAYWQGWLGDMHDT